MIDYKIKSDSWYGWKGAKPPERISHGVTDSEVDTLIKEKLNGHKCQWLQRGADIECTEGDIIHGMRIGAFKRLTGTSPDSEPILIDIQ